jgi:hypothetical protein
MINIVQQTALGGLCQNSQRANHGQFPLSRDSAAGVVIQDEPVRLQLSGERDRLAHSGTEISDSRRLL